MLRKLSTRFRSRKEENSGVNGTTHTVTNGANGINGINGESKGKPNLKERHSSFTPFKSKKDTSNHSVDHSAGRRDVEDSFEQFAQLIHASVRHISSLKKHCTQFAWHLLKIPEPIFSIYHFEGEKLIQKSIPSHDLYLHRLRMVCPWTMPNHLG